MKDYPDTAHGNAKSALEILFEIEALFGLLILIDDENGLARVKENEFFETLQHAGELGKHVVGRCVHFVSLVELHTSDEVIDLEDRFTLPVLISAVLRHRDMPEWLVKGIGELLGENNVINPDSPEYVAIALGLHE